MDPEIRSKIDEKLAEGTPRPYQVSVETARRLVADGIADLAETYGHESVGSIGEYAIEGENGSIPVRVYRPQDADEVPVFVWYHGGGWVRGDLNAADFLCRRFVNEIGCTVVSVGYRRAPEHPFPAGLVDCYDATVWASEHHRITRGDGNGVAVGGPSAGGNLAAAVSLMAADRGFDGIALQVLGVPVVDYSFDTPSYEENAIGNGLTRPDMKYYWDHYLKRDLDGAHPYASPLRRADLTDQPPALVVTGGFDPLRDEGFEYAEWLEAAGVPTDHLHYETMPHGIFNPAYFLAEIDVAVGAIDDICERIREALRTRT